MTAVETDIQYLLPTCDREGRAILTLMGSRMRDMKVRAVMTFWGGFWEKGVVLRIVLMLVVMLVVGLLVVMLVGVKRCG